MKITIDTKQDSRDEIRKIVRLLNELLDVKHDNHHGNQNIQDQNIQGYNIHGSSDFRNQQNTQAGSVDSTGFFSMFDTQSTTSSTTGMAGDQTVNTEDSEKKKVDPAEFEIYEY